MPQIPVFNGAQRIDAASPVSIASTNDARMAGVATAAFGEAVFNLGNAMDATARKVKDSMDKYALQFAMGEANTAMRDQRLKQNKEQIDPASSADGRDGARKYNERLAPILDKIGEQLPNDAIRWMYKAGLQDDLDKNTGQVAATELERREKLVPVLRQQAVNIQAVAARDNPEMLEQALAQVEINVWQDSTVAPVDKQQTILKDKQQAARGFIAGFIKRGNLGDTTAWDAGRKAVMEKLGLILSPEENAKFVDEINSAQFGYSNRANAEEDRIKRAEDRAAKFAVSAASTEYIAKLEEAGTDDVKRNIIQAQMAKDPRFDTDSSKRTSILSSSEIFQQLDDDRYQLKIMDTAMRTKNYTQLLNKILKDSGSSILSTKRGTRLQKMVEGMRDQERTNPGIKDLYMHLQDEIKSLGKSSIIVDSMSGLNRVEVDKDTTAGLTRFSDWYARNLMSGGVTAGSLQNKANEILTSLGRIRVKPTNGISQAGTETLKDTDATIRQINKDFQSGKFKTPAQLKAVRAQMDTLTDKRKQFITNDAVKVKVNGFGSAPKDWDDK